MATTTNQDTATTKFDLKAYIEKKTIDSGRDALVNARDVLDCAIQEINRGIKAYDRATEKQEFAKILNRSIGFLAANVLSNCRLDMMADCQAEIIGMDNKE